jgi:hypothetical protein
VFVAILLLGWVEDVAAARRPRLLPWHRVSRRRTAAAAPDAVRPDHGPAPGMAGGPVSGSTAVGALTGPAAVAPTAALGSSAASAGGAAVPPDADGNPSRPVLDPAGATTDGRGGTDAGSEAAGPTTRDRGATGVTAEVLGAPIGEKPAGENQTAADPADAEAAPADAARRTPESAQV